MAAGQLGIEQLKAAGGAQRGVLPDQAGRQARAAREQPADSSGEMCLNLIRRHGAISSHGLSPPGRWVRRAQRAEARWRRNWTAPAAYAKMHPLRSSVLDDRHGGVRMKLYDVVVHHAQNHSFRTKYRKNPLLLAAVALIAPAIFTLSAFTPLSAGTSCWSPLALRQPWTCASRYPARDSGHDGEPEL